MSKAKRAVVIIIDSAGIGELPDAADFGDQGAATLPHIAEAVDGLNLPNMERLGLGRIAPIKGVEPLDDIAGGFGKMAEKSPGKDTTTGHWEMMGLVLDQPFGLYHDGFPPEIVEPFVKATGREVMANRAASGTQVIEELGAEQLKNGKWILYTSADSVFQLAAHEERIPLDELYAACKIARDILNPYRVGRVIARPFVGEPGSFTRTYNRHDYSIKPDRPTVMNAIQQAGQEVIGVGKINDIYAGVGVSKSFPTSGNSDGIEQTLAQLDQLEQGLLFVNLVDFDMQYGHRRDAAGYARALAEFDASIPKIQEKLSDNDILIITADHGCDPTFMAHTDHTREYVPLLFWSPALKSAIELGIRDSFADLGASLAEFLGVDWSGAGTSFIPKQI
jgi:phosphopentomutase